MAFDPKKFLKEKFVSRTEAVPVPDLREYFGEGEEPVWIVRGLTGQELGKTKEAPAKYKRMTGILEGLMSSVSKEIVESVKSAIGAGTVETPDDVAIRIDQLVIGSVEPKCTLDLAVKLCEAFPVEFYILTNKITILTGQGQLPGKPKPSGGIPESEPACSSRTPGGDSSMKRGRTSSRKGTSQMEK